MRVLYNVSLPTEKLLFVDTNVWLDFYRAREAGLSLLKRVEKLSGLIIVSFQLESEFKRNRQAVLLEGMKALPNLPALTRPGMLSDAAATRALGKDLKEASRHVKVLKTRLMRALQNPAQYDPVYQACQRIFRKEDDLCLTLNHEDRHPVRERAARRHALGFPPRKKNDTSMGDAHNWEWMVQCAKSRRADLVIVTRDSDYGLRFDHRSYLNDHLSQEFHERVGKRRKVFLVDSLSEALKLFSIKVPKREVRAEAEIRYNSGGGHMLDTFTLHEDAWDRDGPVYASGPVIGCRVGGMPHGQTARIANFGAPNGKDWRIMRINADNTQSDWTGHYETVEDALAALQRCQ